MKLNRYNSEGQAQGTVEIQDNLLILNRRGTQAVNDAVVAYLANQRQGTSKVKTRAEVSGGGKKPWRQKGTGRARAGSIRSPLWRHGGVVFGPQPRDWSIKLPKKVKALAFCKAFSDRCAAGDVIVVDDLKVESGKTRDFVRLMKNLKLEGNTLFICQRTKTLERASRNVPTVELTSSDLLNTYQLLRFDHIVMTADALEGVMRRLKS